MGDALLLVGPAIIISSMLCGIYITLININTNLARIARSLKPGEVVDP